MLQIVAFAAAVASVVSAAAKARQGGGQMPTYDLADYAGYAVVSERAAAGPFAAREVLPFSGDEEKAKWCGLLWRDHGKTGAAKAGQRWARVCASPEGQLPKFEPWRDANRWSGCATKQFVGYATGRGAFVELGHGGAGSCVVGDANRLYPVHLNHARKGGKPNRIAIEGHIAHAFGVYPDEVAHNINQFPRLLRVARNVPANDTTLLVHDVKLWRQWVELLRRRSMIPKNLKVRYVGVKKAGTTVFSPKDPDSKVFFAGEAVPVFPDRVTHGWYSLGAEETCAFQLALNRTYVSNLLRACPEPASTPIAEMPAQRGSPGRSPECVVEVLVVSRQDAKTRSVRNHDGLVAAVLASLDATLAVNNCSVVLRVFVGRDHSLASAAAAWRAAHVIVAPHGAALANVVFVQPNALLVEIGYYSDKDGKKSVTEKVGMPWPAPYYWAAAASADSTLFASMAQGSYTGPMTANLKDVRALMTDQIAPRLIADPAITRRHLLPHPTSADCPPSYGGARPA